MTDDLKPVPAVEPQRGVVLPHGQHYVAPEVDDMPEQMRPESLPAVVGMDTEAKQVEQMPVRPDDGICARGCPDDEYLTHRGLAFEKKRTERVVGKE